MAAEAVSRPVQALLSDDVGLFVSASPAFARPAWAASPAAASASRGSVAWALAGVVGGVGWLAVLGRLPVGWLAPATTSSAAWAVTFEVAVASPVCAWLAALVMAVAAAGA